MGKIFLYLKNLDWILFFSVIFLASFGLTEIYSIALGQEVVDLLNFKKQLFFVGVGVFLLFAFSLLDYNFLKNTNKYIYIFGVGILVAVLIFGKEIRNTKGWFSIAGFGIQPVEFVKIILIIFLAYFFSSRATKIRPFKHLLLSGFGTGVFAFLVLMQPDFGSVMLLLAVWFFMLIITGFSKKYFIILGFLSVLLFGALWNFYFENYQKQRILTLLNPNTENSLAEEYNVRQALIAVGSGGLTGRGIGFGSQSQLKFLPEAENDFIFAVISEEFGFLGVFLMILLFSIVFYRCIVATKKMKDDFAIFFVLGAVGLIFIEMFINISMNIGILPVVGISLPFVSYGGSSIISTFILVGILESIIIKSKINY